MVAIHKNVTLEEELKVDSCAGVIDLQPSSHHGRNPSCACTPSLARHRITEKPVRWLQPHIDDCLTNFDLEALGKRTRYSLKFPYSIDGDMTEKGGMDASTPRRGNILGCFRFFQVTISLYAF